MEEKVNSSTDLEKAALEHFRENKSEIFEIAEKAKLISENNYGIIVGNAEIIPTLVHTCFISIAKYLSSMKNIDGDVSINFFDLFNVGITYEECEEGEKDGNYTPFITPSDRIAQAVDARNRIPREFPKTTGHAIMIETKADQEHIEKLKDRFLIEVRDRNKVNTHTGAVTATVFVIFLEELFNFLIENHTEGEVISIKFGTVVKIGLAYDDGKLKPFIIPCEDFRITSKDDANS